jgi:hypothetical protein
MPECPRHVPVSINPMNFLNIHKIHANRTQVTLAHDLSFFGLNRPPDAATCRFPA